MSCYNFLCPIIITEGGTHNQQYRWSSVDPLVPVDLTGYMSLTQVRLKLTDEEPLIDFPHMIDHWVEDGVTGLYLDVDPSTGIYRMYLNDDDAWELCAQHKDLIGVYNLFLYSPGGEAVLRQYGPVSLLASSARKPTP